MKSSYTLYFFIFFLCILPFYVAAQNQSCDFPDPFCTDSGVYFEANFNPGGATQAATINPGNNYSCLISQPNPAWFYLQIGTAGSINIRVESITGVDVDFALWGPFNDLDSAINSCGSYGNPIDCSFSTAAVETVNIPANNSVGDVYILLITNYANVYSEIEAEQISGTGATDCVILLPCAEVDLNAAATTAYCDSDPITINATFSNTDYLTGTTTFSGNGITQTEATTALFDPVVAGIGSHIVTFEWSYTNPAGVLCEGTLTQPISVTNPYDASFTLPNFACTAEGFVFPELPTNGGGGWWTIDGDQPAIIDPITGIIDLSSITQSGIYNITQTLPCETSHTEAIEIGISEFAYFELPQQACISEGIDPIPVLDSNTTSGGVWYANSGNMTIDSYTGQIYMGLTLPGSYIITYETSSSVCAAIHNDTINIIGTQVADFTYSPAAVCQGGGNPSVQKAPGFTNGGVWSVVPTGLAINTATGAIDVAASSPGTYTIGYTTPESPCPDNHSFIFTISAQEIAGFSLPTTVCNSQSAVSPVLEAGTTPNGTWSINNGGSINTTTGQINLAATAPGTYTVTYTTSSSTCNDQTSSTITIVAQENADFSLPSPICHDQDNPTPTLSIGFTNGGTWSINNGGNINASTGQINLASTPAGNYTVTYTTSSNSNCSDTHTANIQIYPIPTSGFTASASQICLNQTVTLTYSGTPSPTATYNWTFNGATVLSGSGAGPYSLQWASAGIKNIGLIVSDNNCISEQTIVPVDVVAPLSPLAVSCIATNLDMVEFGWNTVSSTTGYSIVYSVNGGADQTTSAMGTTYTITNLQQGDEVTITVTAQGNPPCGNGQPATASCTAQSCPSISPTINSLLNNYCVDSPPTTLLGSPAGGTWSGNGVVTGSFSPADAGIGTHNIVYTYTEPNTTCTYSQSQNVSVFDLPTSDFSVNSATICSTAQLEVTYVGTAATTANYTWDFDGATVLSGSGAGAYMLQFPSAGNYTISLTVEENGCLSSLNTRNVTVTEPLLPINPTCTSSTTSDVVFSWNSAGASTIGYAIAYTVNSGTQQTDTINALTYTVNGLTVDDEVLINITPLGNAPCGNGQTATSDCVAQSCPSIGLSLSLTETDFCQLDAPVSIEVSPTGGVLTGNGVDATAQTFSPSNVSPGIVSIGYAYTDEATGCEYQIESVVTVHEQATANFTIDKTQICSNGETAIITYTGDSPAGAVFDWDFGTASVVSLGNEVYSVSYNATGNQTISLVVQTDFCVSEPYSQTLEVVAPLPAIAVNCSESTTTSVSFDWNDLSGILGYNISYTINGGAPQTDTVTIAQYQVAGLSINDLVDISVTPLGVAPCGNGETAIASCNAADCPPVVLDILGLLPTYCTANSDVVLAANPVGGVFSGNGISNNIFSPANAGVGQHTITYTYTSPATNCTYSNTATVVVIADPTATFSVSETTVCAGNSFTITYTGNASPNAIYTWDFAGAEVISGSGQGPYVVQFSNAGTYTMNLSVAENNCSGAAEQDIVIVAPLEPLVVNCTSVNLNSVSFGWNTIAGATGYSLQITTPSGVSSATITETTYTVTGLLPQQSATISVTALGNAPCGNGESAAQTCTAQDCPPLTISILNIADSYCSDAAPTTLVASPAGGNFTIDGASFSVLDPGLLEVGQHTITYLYETSEGCPYSTDTTFIITPLPNPQFEIAKYACIGEEFTASFVGEASSTATFSWDFGEAGTATGIGPHSLVFDTAGEKVISLIITENGICSAEYTATVDISQASVTTTALEPVLIGSQIILNATATANFGSDFSYTWTASNGTVIGNSAEVTTTADNSNVYTVSVSDENGCSASATVAISVFYPNEAILPNAFSPNGDNQNDIFRVRGFNLSAVSLQVYDRWGEQVFAMQDANPDAGWNGEQKGKPAAIGTYVYIVTIRFENGDEETLKGNVILIR